MLSREETAVFAWLIKQQGGKVSIPQHDLLALEGWLVEFAWNMQRMTLNVKLTRVGETYEGTATRLHDDPSPGSEGLRSQQRALPMRPALLAQGTEPKGAREIPSPGGPA